MDKPVSDTEINTVPSSSNMDEASDAATAVQPASGPSISTRLDVLDYLLARAEAIKRKDWSDHTRYAYAYTNEASSLRRRRLNLSAEESRLLKFHENEVCTWWIFFIKDEQNFEGSHQVLRGYTREKIKQAVIAVAQITAVSGLYATGVAVPDTAQKINKLLGEWSGSLDLAEKLGLLAGFDVKKEHGKIVRATAQTADE